MSAPSTSQNDNGVVLDSNQRARLIKNIHTRIHSVDGQLSIRLHMREMLRELMKNFRAREIPIGTAFLVGGAASHIVHEGYSFTDLDVELEVNREEPINLDEEKMIFDGIKDVILGFLRNEMKKAKFNLEDSDLMQKFIAKQVLILNPTEAWSLISFHHADGVNLEIKSVLRMARKYQFGTDSLRIDLSPLLSSCGDFPVSSSYGTVKEVTELLVQKRIKTKNPEKIHGGGLLKYCLLKSKGFQNIKEKQKNLNKLHKAMLNGFLGTFKKGTITKFLQNHFRVFQIEERHTFLKTLDQFLNSKPCEEVPREMLEPIRKEINFYNCNH